MSETFQIIVQPPKDSLTKLVAIPRIHPSLHDILRSQLKTLREHRRAVLELEDPDAIHKMRVSTRRVQASLDLLVTPDDALRVTQLKRLLRRSRRRLSVVRNYDVFLELIAKESALARRVARERFGLLSSVLKERRALRMDRIREFLVQLDIEVIPRRLGMRIDPTPITTPPATADDLIPVTMPASASDLIEANEVSDVFQPSRVALRAAERLEQRVSQFQLMASQVHETTNPSDLHQLRIAAKRVRYLLEVVSEMGYGQPVRALAWLRSLQDRIGDWHDFEALEDEIVDLVSRQRFLKQNLLDSVVMLQVAGHLQKKKLQLVSRLFPIRVPKALEITSSRIVRRLRRAV